MEYLKSLPMMIESFRGFFSGDFNLESLFWCCAAIGSSLFVMRLLLSFLGLGDSDAIDALHTDASDVTLDTDAGLHIFSLTTFTGFLMMFGWTGISALNDFEASPGVALLFASSVGLITMVILAIVMRFIFSMGEPGDTYKPEDAIGGTGEVFEKIPADGRGMISTIVKGDRREFKAISDDGTEIQSFTQVNIIKLIGQDTVVVKKIS